MNLKSILKSIKINEPLISTVLGALVVATIALMLVNYFRNKVNTLPSSPPAVQTESTPQKPNLPTTYKVEKGDSLWAISEKYYQSGYNWIDIASANNLANPNLIEEGQELTIPQVETKQEPAGKVAQQNAPPEVKPQITPKAAQIEAITENSYKVVKGDSLWKISVRAFADGYQWTKLWSENKDKIKNPNLIYPDQEFTIPR